MINFKNYHASSGSIFTPLNETAQIKIATSLNKLEESLTIKENSI